MTDVDTPPPSGRRWRRIALVVLVLVAAAAPLWGPPVLRPLAFFRVKHVEVRGTRYASPADVAKALAVDTMRSLWDDTGVLERRVRALPQIREAEVSRRIPSTLIVTVEENIPIALVAGPNGFHAYDEEGRSLSLDPSRTPVDLPIIARRDTALLRLLGEVRASDPSLFARISELRRSGQGELVMQLVSVPVRTMLDVTVDQLAQIAPVEEDLLKRRARPVELDLRFKDQVIARIQ